MKRWKRAAAAAVCASLALTACGTGGDERNGMAMGRYMEEQLTHPDTQSIASYMTDEGSLLIYGMDWDGNKLDYGLYESADGTDWSRQPLELELPEDISIDAVSRVENGDLYVLSSVVEIDESTVDLFSGYTYSTVLYRISSGGEAEMVPIEWHTVPDNDNGTLGREIMLLDNGDFLIEQFFDGYCQYSPDGSFKRVYGQWSAMKGSIVIDCAVYGNNIALLDTDTSSVLIYDADTYALKNKAVFDNMTASTILATGRDGALYLVSNRGLYRLPSGGNMWERLVDGELVSLGMPTVVPTAFFEKEDGSYLVMAEEDDMGRLFAYRYHPDVSTLPDYELSVYTLQENATLRQAAALYQRNHPDTKVAIQVGSYEGGIGSDAIRALNTQLLAEKGPDVLVLDGLNADSYIDKGAFLDLQVTVAGLDGALLDPAVWAYGRETGLYAVPARIQLPAIFTQAGYIESMNSLESAAALAAVNPQTGFVGNREPDVLMRLFLPSSAPAINNGKAIDEENLSRFLELLKEIYSQLAESYDDREPGEPYDYDVEAFHWAYGRALTQAKILAGYETLYSPNAAMEALGGGEVTYLPGLSEAVFIPSVVTAVNQNTSQPERAKEFVLSLLAPDVQKTRMEEGFPVLLEALSDHQFNEWMYYYYGSSSFGGEVLSGGDVPVSLQETVKELVLGIKTPYKADEVLTEMIIDEAEDYFTGEKSLAEAVSDIQERARLYLAE